MKEDFGEARKLLERAYDPELFEYGKFSYYPLQPFVLAYATSSQEPVIIHQLMEDDRVLCRDVNGKFVFYKADELSLPERPTWARNSMNVEVRTMRQSATLESPAEFKNLKVAWIARINEGDIVRLQDGCKGTVLQRSFDEDGPVITVEYEDSNGQKIVGTFSQASLRLVSKDPRLAGMKERLEHMKVSVGKPVDITNDSDYFRYKEDAEDRRKAIESDEDFGMSGGDYTTYYDLEALEDALERYEKAHPEVLKESSRDPRLSQMKKRLAEMKVAQAPGDGWASGLPEDIREHTEASWFVEVESIEEALKFENGGSLSGVSFDDIWSNYDLTHVAAGGPEGSPVLYFLGPEAKEAARKFAEGYWGDTGYATRVTASTKEKGSSKTAAIQAPEWDMGDPYEVVEKDGKVYLVRKRR